MIEAKRMVIIEGNDRVKKGCAWVLKERKGLLNESVVGGNWAQERSSGATRHPEKRKGTTQQT
jgi:hypothetical protein